MRHETRTEQVIAAMVATTIFWFCIFMIAQPCKAGWVSGDDKPLPEEVIPVNPYVYLPADSNPSPIPNRAASLMVSGWANLYYSVVIHNANVSRSKVLQSYYRNGSPECHQFTLRLTFVPKRGTVVTIDRTCSLYPPQFDHQDPTLIVARISQFSARQEEMTELIKTMDTLSVELVDCDGRSMESWVFQLAGTQEALAEVER